MVWKSKKSVMEAVQYVFLIKKRDHGYFHISSVLFGASIIKSHSVAFNSLLIRQNV